MPTKKKIQEQVQNEIQTAIDMQQGEVVSKEPSGVQKAMKKKKEQTIDQTADQTAEGTPQAPQPKQPQQPKPVNTQASEKAAQITPEINSDDYQEQTIKENYQNSYPERPAEKEQSAPPLEAPKNVIDELKEKGSMQEYYKDPLAPKKLK